MNNGFFYEPRPPGISSGAAALIAMTGIYRGTLPLCLGPRGKCRQVQAKPRKWYTRCNL